jgi:hypothetical protein
MSETMTIDTLPDAAKRRRAKHVPKPRPMSPERLDARLAAAKKFDAIVSGLTAELGGNLTIRQRGFVEAFAGCRINLDDYNARRLLGQSVDPLAYNTTVSNMVSLSECIDIERRASQQEEACA